MSYKIKLYHLYPDAMNLYGDLGNVLTLKKRCEWRGIGFEVVDVKIGDRVDFSDADILYMGGRPGPRSEDYCSRFGKTRPGY